MRRFLRRLFHRAPMCPASVTVEWPEWMEPRRRWPDRLVEMWEVPRNVTGRRLISGLIGTTAWVWVGPRTIRVLLDRPVPPTGGSGTAPPRAPDAILPPRGGSVMSRPNEFADLNTLLEAIRAARPSAATHPCG